MTGERNRELCNAVRGDLAMLAYFAEQRCHRAVLGKVGAGEFPDALVPGSFREQGQQVAAKASMPPGRADCDGDLCYALAD